jgi:hypothetical protein|tara:strand:- start:552 stop:1043 length:492 start_codon:yes stop_codon:yes gene_type:complete
LINDVEELIALGAGDKYRLNDTRERLERGKKLYISDLEYLEKLVKTHLGRRLSPEPRKPKRVIRQVEESEPSQPQTESGKKSRKEELKEYEKKYLAGTDDGFTINEDGEIGEKTSRNTEEPKEQPVEKSKEEQKKDSAFGMCVKCGAAISVEDLFCTSCGAKR